MTDQTPMSTTRTAPLDELTLHAFNPRQVHDPEDIAALAISLSLNGLMQNLNALEEDGRLGIVAGGRRLRALEHLRSQGSDFADSADIDFDAIPVNVTTDPALARSWAGSEGATQRPLHPADEIRAYAAMADHGSDADQIAAAFGQSKAHVQRRLKLAGLSPAALDALRSGSITLDVAQVLTVTGGEEREAEALKLATEHRYSADRLRHQLMEGNLPSSDRRVRYIGLDLYRAEGGTLDEDLFSDQSRLHNVELVDHLFQIKLRKAAEELQATEGFGRVIPIFDTWVGYQHTESMSRIFRQSVELPEADATRHAELCEIGETQTFTEEEKAEFDALEQRMLGDYKEDERDAATVFVLVDRNGALEVSSAYLPASRGNGSSTDTNDVEVERIAPKPPITQSGIEDLRRIERLALQARMITQAELALDLLAFQLWTEMPSFAGPFNIRAEEQLSLPEVANSLTIDKRVTGEDDEQASASHENFDEEFDAFMAKGKKHRNQVLTTLLARTMNAPFASPANRALLRRLDVSPRTIWTPTAESLFNACRSEALDSIWRELVVTEEREEQMERFAKLKVGEKRKELEKLFNDASTQEALGLSRNEVAAIDSWLPDVMKEGL
ncbi:ParB N-terminal domain-containing protein [Sulfitobacter sp. W074]|uniref:ParB/RepB/Spo0J family partition protein n=1 Tax=Sulfitobacter sp. W074 TaxID=2867026 RepID=UPI0021A3F329|nr:ParB N-terminal domain-containing protein [Sulfitobacter sp. W074]UWR36183.1 ParB N-terminal domain-containing protein [Sulfitobacter sp. W074]